MKKCFHSGSAGASPNPRQLTRPSKRTNGWTLLGESSKLSSLSPDAGKIGANALLQVCSNEAPGTGPAVAWHSILSQPQPVVSTAALRDSVGLGKAPAAVTIPVDGVQLGSYVKWWAAVLTADLSTLQDLCDNYQCLHYC